jgi:hypothetical protein
MNELKTAIAVAFDKVVESGAIEQAIEKQLTETISGVIREQLRSYSDIGKAIEAQVKASLNIGTMELPSYADLIGKIVRRQVEAGMQNEATRHLEKNIAELLAPAPAEITLEQLIEDFINHRLEYSGDDIRGDSFTLLIEHSEGSTDVYKHIHIDPEHGTRKYSCAIQLDVTPSGEVYGLKLGGRDLKDQLFVGPLYDFERKLFQLFTAKSKLIVSDDADASDFDTSYPYHGDD